jgi:hypothetical protein
MHNPSLREETRYQRSTPIPPTQGASIIEWLEGTGRLIARETQEIEISESEDPEISDLMGDNTFGDDDDFQAEE